MEAQPSAIGAGQLDLGHGGGLGPGGGGWHFDKAQGQRGQRRGRLVTGRHLFFEICQAHPHLFGHAGGRQRRGQRHGVLPELMGNALVGVRPRLTPVRKLAGQLVELVVDMQRGRERHNCLHVIGFLT